MQFNPRRDDPLFDSLETVVKGLGLSILDFSVSRHRDTVQVRLTVYKKGAVGVADCSKAHKAIVPRLELAFPGLDIGVEVASPGIDRNIKDASEFPIFLGRGVRCYRSDISDWTAGIISEADEKSLVLRGKDTSFQLPYEIITKAKLDYSQEVED